MLAELQGSDDLPAGWTDEQDGGTYRLRRRDDDALFGYAVGPHSLEGSPAAAGAAAAARAARRGGRLRGSRGGGRGAALRLRRRAFVRPARHGHPGPGADGRGIRGSRLRRAPARRVRRGGQLRPGRRDLLLRVDGHRAAVHRGLRPRAHRGPGRRRAPLRRRGRQRARAPRSWPSSRHRGGRAGRERGPRRGGRARALRRWAERWRRGTCRSCSRPTSSTRAGTRWPSAASPAATARSVCPTCFCTTVEDVTDLTGQEAERNRRWDSCFTLDLATSTGARCGLRIARATASG